MEHRADMLKRAEPRICAFDIETTKLPLQFPNAEHDQVMLLPLLEGERCPWEATDMRSKLFLDWGLPASQSCFNNLASAMDRFCISRLVEISAEGHDTLCCNEAGCTLD